jgi:hypothetical protein
MMCSGINSELREIIVALISSLRQKQIIAANVMHSATIGISNTTSTKSIFMSITLSHLSATSSTIPSPLMVIEIWWLIDI